jgi:predicted O-methyltransferase YrrM
LYSPFQLAKKYIRYRLTSSNGKGHGVHSPFVFNFIHNILRDKKKYACYSAIEDQRKKLLQNETIIEIEDFGAGSATLKSNKRVVKNIAASSLKSAKFAQLLYRIVQYYKPDNVLELGTSLGITTAYMANANKAGKIYTCEGAATIAAIATKTFNDLYIENFEVIQGDFAETLQPLLKRIVTFNLVFIDGNHRKEPTIEYFNQILAHSTPDSIFIFDDIHWSKEMETAWQHIQQHAAVTLTIDLFFIGLVFINHNFKVKQLFTIKF